MRAFLLMVPLLGVIGLGLSLLPASAQREGLYADTGEARAALDEARMQANRARQRVAEFERRAREAGEAADKAKAEAGALAARIQQAEAAISVAEAQFALVQGQRRMLDEELAERREPIVRLMAGLQSLVRRPLALSVLRPGSLRETVYLGAIIDSTIPLVRERTADLRGDLDRARGLVGEAQELIETRRENERQLALRRQQMVALAAQERVSADRAAGDANREETRALALAEETRDLDALVGRLEDAGSLRQRLAALPGPILRPPNPASARATAPVQPAPSPTSSAAPTPYRLPVDGRIVAGFGEADLGGGRLAGISLAPRSRAQIVAPAPGRVAFAGPYRGFGQIVIIEHEGGWTSLVTGLAELDTRVGDEVIAGSPLGRAGERRQSISLELRREGDPVNPLEFLS